MKKLKTIVKYHKLLNKKIIIQNDIYDALKIMILEDELSKKLFTNNGKFICPICNGTRTCKGGINAQGKQKYKCHDCNKQMITQQNIITFSSKKSFSQWVVFLESLLDGDSLKLSAEKADISVRTAFRWRHKILYLLNNLLNKEVLIDTIYIDETLFQVVYKNPKKVNSKDSRKRGMSEQKINVTCAIDIHGNTLLKTADKGRVKSSTLINIYNGKIKKGSKVISDSLRSYLQLMKHLEIEWKKIPSKKKSIDNYDLEKVNNLHSLIKDFIYKYKGISIKYLQGYLALFDFQQKNKNHHNDSIFYLILATIFTASSNLKCSDIDSIKPLYT